MLICIRLSKIQMPVTKNNPNPPMPDLSQSIRSAIRDVPDFPKPGIIFKDITPLLLDHLLYDQIIEALYDQLRFTRANYVCGIESRGFFFGPALAAKACLPFVPIRKAGKLPGDVAAMHYSLEYGSATIEVQSGVIPPGSRVFLHDDLIATGGTAKAAVDLIESIGSEVVFCSFLINLTMLPGDSMLRKRGLPVGFLAGY
jgi:adenine phosphoribosyltransferase